MRALLPTTQTDDLLAQLTAAVETLENIRDWIDGNAELWGGIEKVPGHVWAADIQHVRADWLADEEPQL